MRKNLFSKHGLIWALAAAMAVAAPGTMLVHAAARMSDAALLESQLPRGETLRSASMKEVEAAVRAAVAERPASASEIVKIAILARTPKRRPIACEDVKDIVSFAVASAPEQAREIAEMAQSLAPDCGDAIGTGLRGPVGPVSAGAESGLGASVGDGFGAGLGPGFPGSPGFGGSAPSGGFALPTPNPTPVTSSVNA